MNSKRLPAFLFLISAGIFLSIGLRGASRNSTYIVLGIVFFVLGIGALRRSRQV